MQDNLRGLEIASPTPVQMQVLPLMLGGRDVLATAPPGSGKSKSCLLSALSGLMYGLALSELMRYG